MSKYFYLIRPSFEYDYVKKGVEYKLNNCNVTISQIYKNKEDTNLLGNEKVVEISSLVTNDKIIESENEILNISDNLSNYVKLQKI